MDPGVDVTDLAKRTKNFSGAEIEGLVRAAQSSAMNRLVKAGGKVQVSQDDAEKLMVTSEDFDYALEHDIKPVSNLPTFIHLPLLLKLVPLGVRAQRGGATASACRRIDCLVR